ncbi:glycerophosphodiester phosphodiesterase [Kitasatospora sp. NPDC059571]|uniref:glycerophosphodiester phosphodiesterase n=1 Tax=Kitasatospora sp. NPDC059571 TaxID=3346871 RepID=UPI0036AB7181
MRTLLRAAAVAGPALLIAAAALPADSTGGTAPDRCTALAVAGHRGSPRSAPENTMDSFEAALREGADWLETDVRTTRDGVPVLMHDATVDRVTDGRGAVADLTSAQIAALRVTAGPGAPRPVPTLDALLRRIAGTDVRLLMEIKEQRGPADDARIARAAAASGARVVLYSFYAADLRAAHAAAPDLPLVLIQGAGTAQDPGDLPLAGIALDSTTATPARVAAEHSAGRAVYVWTLDDPAAWRTAADSSADALITDLPAGARRWSDRNCPTARVRAATAP